jgi:hypothetical protein
MALNGAFVKLEKLNSIVLNRRFFYFGWIGLCRGNGNPGRALKAIGTSTSLHVVPQLQLPQPRGPHSRRNNALEQAGHKLFPFYAALSCVMCAEYSANPVACHAKCKEFFSNFVPLVYFYRVR